MSNHLARDKKLLVMQMMSEGMGITSIERVIKAHTVTIMNLRDRAAREARRIIEARFTGLSLPFLEVDELWTFIGRKRGYCPHATSGRVWIYVALDPITKLAPAFLIGQRTKNDATRFMFNLRACLSDDTQISTDKLSSYVRAIEHTNGDQLWTFEDGVYLGHARTVGAARNGRAQTNHIETHNGQLRNHVAPLRRSSRLFSKTREGLEEHLWIYFFHYNFVKIHSSLGETPAMRAGLATEPWCWMRLLKAAKEPGFARQKKKRRGAYGQRIVQHAAA